MREPDFTGWATVYGKICNDGKNRVIKDGAFADQDGETVPLMFQHNHKDPEMIIGHAILHSVPGMGVRCDGFFNDGPKAAACKRAKDHKDVTSLSIWANELVEQGNAVCHGIIREVSIVLAGANPAARIDYTSLHHAGLSDEEMYSDAVIYSGVLFDYGDDLEHSADEDGEGEYYDDEEQDVLHASEEGDPEVEAFINGEPSVDDLIAAYSALSEDEMVVMNKAMRAANKGKEDEAAANELVALLERKSPVERVKLLALVALAGEKKDESNNDDEEE